MTLKSWLPRCLALMLAVYCGIQAWAGFNLYRGERLYQSGHFESALRFLNRGAVWDRGSPDVRMFQGLSHWKLWKKMRQPEDLQTAQDLFRRVTQLVPLWGRAWFYRALSEKTALNRNKISTEEDKEAVKAMFEKARLLEPGSPWMAVQNALETLGGPATLSETERKILLKRLRWALTRHYPDQASPYLRQVYGRLWELGLGKEVTRVTPKEAPSYGQLVQFFKDMKQWDAYAESEAKLGYYRQESYQNFCDLADAWLQAGKKTRAAEAYRLAIPYQPEAYRAKAGLLASQARVRRQQKSGLESALLCDEEELGFYWERLQETAAGMENAFVRGLLAFRLANYRLAAEELGKNVLPDHKGRRRFLAQSYLEMGQMDGAGKLLMPLLNEKAPDLRELLLLERFMDHWDKAMQSRYTHKVEETASRRITAARWASQTSSDPRRLEFHALTGVPVNLKPGRVRIRILLKVKPGPDGEPALVRLRLWDDEREHFVGMAVVSASAWRPITWDTETTGGWRWLQLELENGAKAGTVLELGPVHLEYLE